MNKKLKLAIPFAVLAISCGSAVALTGCNKDSETTHTHNYSRWNHDDTYHWKECPDDGAIDESSKEEHLFIAGVCDDCGATQQSGPVTNAEYGKVTGAVRLYKYGEYITDALSGIQVDMGDDDVEISGSVADGKYSFTIENVQVDKLYALTISCNGYQGYSTEIMLEEDGEEAKIGGTNGVTLKYEVFKTFWGWDTELHDLSNVNEANPTIGLDGNGGNTLNVISADKYDDVSVTIHAKSANAGVIQGLLMKFEDGKAAMFNLKTDQSLVQFRPKEFGVISIFNPNDDDTWKESPAGSVTDADKAKFNGDGIDVTLTRKGGTLYAFLDGRYVYSIDLPSGYEDDKIQVGVFAFAVKAGAVFSYDITDEVPEMKSALNINVTKPDGIDCTVTASPQKDVYDLDEEVELTFTAPQGYKLSALTVGGEDMLSDVSEGKLTIKANKISLDVCATFAEEQPIALNLSVKGKKLGTTAALADGTTVTFKNTAYSFTVNNGTISAESVTKGRYTVVVDGYFEQQIDFDENLTEVTLEYDLFKVLRWDTDGHSLSHVNDEDSYVEFVGPGSSLNVVSKQKTLGDASVSVTIKGSQTNDGGKQQGIMLVFEDGKAAILNINTDGTPRLQFRPELFSDDNDESIGLRTAFTKEGVNWKDVWVEFKNVTTDEVAKYNSDTGIVLTVVRKGNLLYVFVDGVYHGTATLPEEYANDEMGFGLFAFGAQAGSKWYFEVSETLPDMSVRLTDETPDPDVAHGSLTGIPATANIGDTVTLTIVAEQGYKLSALSVNGTNVIVTGTTYSFVVMGDTTVSAEFTQIVPGSVNAVISGTKLGSTTPFAEGTQVKLTCQGMDDVTAEITATGLVIDNIAAGEWTVNVQGYLPVKITVENETEYSQEIVLEYDLFKIIQWDESGHGFDHVNDADPYVEWVSDSVHSLNTVSKECWLGDATVSVTIKSSLTTNANNEQGLIVSFEDGKAAILNINTSDPLRLQFRPNLFDNISTAFTTEWVEFKNVTAAELAKYNSETGIVLKIVRQGNLLYVFIDDTYHGTATLPETYKTSQMGIGVYSFNAVYGAKWYFNVSENIPDLSVTVNTSEMQNGSVTVSEGVKLGGTVTVTVNPDTNYMLDNLTVIGNSGKQVTTAKIEDNVFTFIADENSYEVSATFAEVSQIASVEFVADSALNANGLQYTLSREGYASYTGTIADNKFTATDVEMGDWTLSTEIYGVPVSFNVSVSSNLVNIDFSSVLAEGSDTTMVNLGESGIVFLSQDGKSVGIKSNITGDAWFAGKVNISAADLETLKNGGQATFAVYVKFSNGDSKYVGLNISNNGSDCHLCLTDGNWWEDGHSWDNGTTCSTQLGSITKGTGEFNLNSYGQALFGDGLYYIVNYNADTGYLSVYYATGDSDLKLAKIMAHDPVVNATITEFGINRGLNWGSASITYNVTGFGYSDTLKPEWENARKITVADTVCTNGSVTVVDSENAKIGDNIVITVTPDEGYKCISLIVNGSQQVNNISDNRLVYFAQSDISIKASFIKESQIITDNTADIVLSEGIGDMDVLAYASFSDGDNVFEQDDSNLLDISAATNNKNGTASDFNSHGWAVTAEGLENGNAPCITGEFDMNIKLVKGVQQIRLFVGGWWMSNHGGTFTLKSADGETVYDVITYCSVSGNDPNDILIINVDTTMFADDETVDCMLHFDGTGFDQLPFAGVQILGTKTAA